MSTQEARTYSAFVGYRHPEDNRLAELAREGLVRLAKWVSANSRYRRTVAELRAMTDRELDDIGIARCDIITIARASASAERANI